MNSLAVPAVDDFMRPVEPDFVKPPRFEVNFLTIVRPAHDYGRVGDERQLKPSPVGLFFQPRIHMRGHALPWSEFAKEKASGMPAEPKASHGVCDSLGERYARRNHKAG